jgi:hypothetical protein
MTVKVAAKVQPVPPPADNNNGPFRQVEFGGMTATAYIDDNGNFSRIAWSLRASEVRAPSKNGKPASDKAAV